MAKRVGVVLSGCGPGDGSEIREVVLALLSIERAGAEAICAAPDVAQARIVDHSTGVIETGPPRRVLAEAARIARGPVRALSALAVDDIDAIVFPGGQGVATVLSNYADKGAICDVHPDVVRLLKGHLTSRRPIGLVCLAPILAARVLGPIAGVRLTLGPRGTAAARDAAVMGADIRPAPARDIVVDQKARVVSTPAYMYDDARLTDVAAGIDKMVRTVLSFARDRSPKPAEPRSPPEARPPQGRPPGGAAAGATRGRGSA